LLTYLTVGLVTIGRTTCSVYLNEDPPVAAEDDDEDEDEVCPRLLTNPFLAELSTLFIIFLNTILLVLPLETGMSDEKSTPFSTLVDIVLVMMAFFPDDASAVTDERLKATGEVSGII
jgi:hypothetical protein